MPENLERGTEERERIKNREFRFVFQIMWNDIIYCSFHSHCSVEIETSIVHIFWLALLPLHCTEQEQDDIYRNCWIFFCSVDVVIRKATKLDSDFFLSGKPQTTLNFHFIIYSTYKTCELVPVFCFTTIFPLLMILWFL